MVERSEALNKHNSDPIGYLERTEDGHFVPIPQTQNFAVLEIDRQLSN